MQGTLKKKFQEICGQHIPNFNEIYANSWDLIYEERDHQANNNDRDFEMQKLIISLDKRTNCFFVFECSPQHNPNVKEVFGYFSPLKSNPHGLFGEQSTRIQIFKDMAEFCLKYTPNEELHFQKQALSMNHWNGDDYSYSGEINCDFNRNQIAFMNSFLYMRFHQGLGIHRLGQMNSDIQCLEGTYNYNGQSYFINRIEVWSLSKDKPKPTINTSKDSLNQMLVSKKCSLYDKQSPLNYFETNMIFEVSKSLPLALLSHKIFGEQMQFLDNDSNNVAASTLISDLKSSTQNITSIKFRKLESTNSDIALPNYKNKQPINEQFKKIDGMKSLIEEAKKKISSLNDQNVKTMWLTWIEEIESFSRLPGFLDLLLKNEKCFNLLFDMIVGKSGFGSKNQNPGPLFGQNLTGHQNFDASNAISQLNQLQINVQNMYQMLQQQQQQSLFGGPPVHHNRPGQPQNKPNPLQDLNNEIQVHTLKALQEVFEQSSASSLREMCVESGTLAKMIERLGQLQTEKKRSKGPQNEEVKQEETKKEEQKIMHQQPYPQYDQWGNLLPPGQQMNQKKGVGYGTSGPGDGERWDITNYLKSKEQKNAQAMTIVNLITQFLKTTEWQANQQVKDIFLESAFLPCLESVLRSGSLLEMVKQYDLVMSYLQFIQELANNQPSLLPLLQEIGDEYYPRQLDSVASLIQKVEELASVFLGLINEESKEEEKKESEEDQKKPRALAEQIKNIHKIVQEKLSQTKIFSKKIETIEDIIKMPLAQAYSKLLTPMKFDKANLKNAQGNYVVKYNGQPVQIDKPVASKMVRLSQEIADLSKSLPCDHTNAIFCRVDKQRMDVMRFIIMGASETPYAHGAFMYEMHFKNDFPSKPPVCSICTTGGGAVRFNPNLYDNGYICLSILGTWRTNTPSENWDPKLSSILQILLSIQACVMSNGVYFNEPGHEHEMGSPHGEAQNNGCSNIIRYCNIKYAMIDMIDNPPPGFEKVIRANFYLKKNVILREVKQWVDDAPKLKATYQGFIHGHNPHWSQLFSIPGKYAEMMKEIYEELKNKLDSLPSPFETQGGGKLERHFSTRGDEKNKLQQIPSSKLSETKSNLNTITEEIDVTYDEETKVQNNELNVNDAKVKDRWSRYIGALGIDAVAKQAQSRILICGMGALGIEIAKNITLAGCKELIIYDSIKPSKADLSGQFFLTEKDVMEKKQSRAHCSRDKLQQLNFYVKITVLDLESPLAIKDYIESQGDIKVAVFTEHSMFTRDQLHSLNNTCRATHTAFINTSQTGLFGSCFNDFGPSFTVIDKNGEEAEESMIKSIELNDKGKVVVTVLGQRHKFEDGDVVQFREVNGLVDSQGKSINDMKDVKISVINPQKFELLNFDLQKYSKYESAGIAKQIKIPLTLSFKTLQEIDQEADHLEFFDQNLIYSDFSKTDNIRILHYVQKVALSHPGLNNQGETLEKVVQILPEDLKEQKGLVEKVVSIYYKTLSTSFAPISAYLGGFVAQEIVVAITQKYSPIKQFYYYDLSELYIDQSIAIEKDKDWKEVDQSSSDRYHSLEKCIGKDLVDKIHNCNLFMIGAGAIGCELLKNYAMLGLGTSGKITLTDPDVIEVSNLNRQFLFREKHLRKPKSQTAAAAAIQMNPDLKNHVEARLDKVCDDTIEIYDEEFFKAQSIVTNALDNVKARLFIDSQCVQSRTALIDSGTLGPKGHVQVIIPALKTQSYASLKDPDENEGEIPQCTLKQFPEETLHCLEWAKSKFGDLFTLKPQSFNKVVVLEKDRNINFSDVQEVQSAKKIVKMIEKKPKSFDDCLLMARFRFQKYFFNGIKQLLHDYPLDKTDKEGKLIWAPPRRIPKIIEFDPINEMHQNVIAAYSCLLANMYGIKIPYDHPRSEMAKQNMAIKASKFPVPAFLPKEQIAAPAEEVKQEESSLIDQPKSQSKQEIDDLINKFMSVVEPVRKNQSMKLQVEEFEKDNDENFHIDFIHAMTNVRAGNYKLDEMDWITVKIKAGKIIPALATTTAAIAALQTIEIIRFLKDSKLEDYKQSFLNLSVPIICISEPGPARKIKLGSTGLQVTLWDRWEFKAPERDVTLLEILEHLESTYKLQVSNILYEGMSLYMSFDYQTLEDRNDALSCIFLLDQTHEDSEQKDFVTHIDLTVTFVEPAPSKQDDGVMMIDTSSTPKEGEQKIIEGTPIVRVYLPQ